MSMWEVARRVKDNIFGMDGEGKIESWADCVGEKREVFGWVVRKKQRSRIRRTDRIESGQDGGGWLTSYVLHLGGGKTNVLYLHSLLMAANALVI